MRLKRTAITFAVVVVALMATPVPATAHLPAHTDPQTEPGEVWPHTHPMADVKSAREADQEEAALDRAASDAQADATAALARSIAAAAERQGESDALVAQYNTLAAEIDKLNAQNRALFDAATKLASDKTRLGTELTDAKRDNAALKSELDASAFDLTDEGRLLLAVVAVIGGMLVGLIGGVLGGMLIRRLRTRSEAGTADGAAPLPSEE